MTIIKKNDKQKCEEKLANTLKKSLLNSIGN